MPTVKIAVSIDRDVLSKFDQLVAQARYPNRDRAVQEAIQEKMSRLRRSRLARECAKLDPKFEQALSEEGLAEAATETPDY